MSAILVVALFLVPVVAVVAVNMAIVEMCENMGDALREYFDREDEREWCDFIGDEIDDPRPDKLPCLGCPQFCVCQRWGNGIPD